MEAAEPFGVKGEVIEDVNEALNRAISTAGGNDMVFVGGSTFVIAEIEGL